MGSKGKRKIVNNNAVLMEIDKAKYKTKLVELGDKIWNTFFKLDNKVFKLKHYKFDHSIITDGVGCSIQFIREEDYNKYAPKTKNLTNLVVILRITQNSIV